MQMQWRIGPSVEIDLDHQNKVIHVLDLDEGRTLTNAIDTKFQRDLLTRMEETYEIDELTWFLYHTDGMATQFVNERFQFIKQDDPRLHPEFMDVMKQRCLA